jgi:hypothetical protein
MSVRDARVGLMRRLHTGGVDVLLSSELGVLWSAWKRERTPRDLNEEPGIIWRWHRSLIVVTEFLILVKWDYGSETVHERENLMSGGDDFCNNRNVIWNEEFGGSLEDKRINVSECGTDIGLELKYLRTVNNV